MKTLEVKKILRHRFFRDLSQLDFDTLDERAVEAKIRDLLRGLRRDGYRLDTEEQTKVVGDVLNDIVGLGPIQPLMADPEITEIMINGPKHVFVERNGVKRVSPVVFDDEQHLRQIIEKMLRVSGKRLDEASPWVDVALPDGSRINIVIPPVVPGGPHLTVRKYLRSLRRVEDLIRVGSLDERMAHFLYACIRSRMNIIFSGATGSGKTTLMELLTGYIDDNERIVVLEDTQELQLSQPDVVRMLTRLANIEGKGEITMRDLFRNCLRMRPTRIVLGEIRGREAMDLLQALTSGHRGSLAVIHSSSPEEALIRLEHLALLAGLNVPVSVIRMQIVHGLDIVVQLAQLTDGARKVVRISEIQGLDPQGTIAVRDLFAFREQGVGSHNQILGRHVALGHVPRFFPRLRMYGIQLEESVFRAG